MSGRRSTTSFYIVKVMDTQGAISFRALTSADYRKLRSELKKQYEESGKKWRAAKKQADSAGQQFTNPEPVQPRYRTLDRLTDRTRAQRLAAAYQKRFEEQQRAKEKAKEKANTI